MVNVCASQLLLKYTSTHVYTHKYSIKLKLFVSLLDFFVIIQPLSRVVITFFNTGFDFSKREVIQMLCIPSDVCFIKSQTVSDSGMKQL